MSHIYICLYRALNSEINKIIDRKDRSTIIERLSNIITSLEEHISNVRPPPPETHHRRRYKRI